MKYIRSFNNYRESLTQKEFNEKILTLHDVELSNDDLQLFKNIFEKLLSLEKDESIKLEIKNYVQETNIINEGFFDKLKNRFPKAAEVSKKLSDKAEGVLNKVLQASKNAVSFVKKIGEGIRELFTNVINSSKKYYEEQIKGGKLKEKIQELASSKKEGLKKDVKEIKKVLDFYRKDFLNKLLSSKDKNMTEFLSKEQEPVVESLLLEKGNVIATLVHRIESIPPFSWLHKVAQAGEAGATKFIKTLSDLTNKMGGPAFTLPIVALIVGVVFEQIVKGEAGGWLISLAGAGTPLGMAISGMKMIAAFIALLTVIDATVGEKILGGHSHAEHSEEDKKEEEPQTQEEQTQDKESN
jgi:hypothetical protein